MWSCASQFTSGLLEGCTTSADKLCSSDELAKFWRVLAGYLGTPGPTGEGGRIDLVGCRVLEVPREGDALLKVRSGAGCPALEVLRKEGDALLEVGTGMWGYVAPGADNAPHHSRLHVFVGM